MTSIVWAGGGGLPQRCDPYLVWLDLVSTNPGKQHLSVLLELPADPAKRADALLDLAEAASLSVRLPDTPHQPQTPRFVTAYVPVNRVKVLLASVQSGQQLVRFQLASPRVSSDEAANGQANLPPAARKSRLQSQLKPPGSTQGLPRDAAPGPPLVLVIDDLCNFGRMDMRCRVRSVWDQGRGVAPGSGGVSSGPVQRAAASSGPPNPNWRYYDAAQAVGTAGSKAASAASGKPLPDADADAAAKAEAVADAQRIDAEHYGATLDVQRLLASSDLSDERDGYRQAEYLRQTPHWSHGSLVMHAVAGDWSPERDAGVADHKCVPPASHVHFVQLPNQTVLDTSGISLAGYALDAIHRAVRHAHFHGKQGPSPFVIVNLSYGTHSGPHDGSSMFEQALLELLDIYDGRPGRPALHIVLPAGNSHLWRCHASAWLPRRCTPDEVERDPECGMHTLHWKVLPDDETDSFIEIWFDEGDRVELQVAPPSGEASPWLAPGTAWQWIDGEVLQAALIHPPSTSLGLHGTLALLALAPTRRRADRGKRSPDDDLKFQLVEQRSGSTDLFGRRAAEAPAGVWHIRLRNLGDRAARFNAWVQRDDAAPARSRSSHGFMGRQSYLVDGEASSVDPRATLNGIATAARKDGRRLWVVGAIDEDLRVPLYAAAGPARSGAHIDGPDVAVPVDRSRSQRGARVGGVLSNSRLRVAGTSVAAARFTRILHDHLLHNGPDAFCSWCRPTEWPVPYRQAAGEPEAAADGFRGAANRMRGAEDLPPSRPAPGARRPPQ